MTVRPPGRLRSLIARLAGDRSGISLIYVTVMLPVFIGFSLVAIDGGRLWSLHSSLQNGADALALAGAAELDRAPGAIQAATDAVNNLVSNSTIFAQSVATVNGSGVDLRFLKALPASDASTITSDFVTANDQEARFIEVTVRPVTMNTILPATFLGLANTTNTAAVAVAGFDQAVCNFTPMFVCNPYEESTNTDVLDSSAIFSHMSDPAKRKRLIEMRKIGGNNAQYFPGNFGFLQPPGGNPGASAMRKMFAAVSPPTCFLQNGVNLRTGAIASIRQGLNVRFDMYEGSLNSDKNDPSYRPALNVRKGADPGGNACKPDPAASGAMKLPRDSCFASSSCPYLGGRMGDGDWNKTLYWTTNNFGSSLPSAISGTNVSRYDVYRYEIDNNLVTHASPAGETGVPACYNGPSGSVVDDPDRRIFHGAVLNCYALDASSTYGPISGRSGPFPAVAFAKFFLTEPVESNGNSGQSNDAEFDATKDDDKSIWAEMIDVVQPGGSQSIARDVVQLYR